MRVSTVFRGLLSLGLFSTAFGYDPTDSIMDADSMGSGYLPNHNMDPGIVGSGSFGQIWQYTVPANTYGLTEQFYAKSLVFTPSTTGRQLVYAFSEQNKIYALDAVNGTLVAMRNLATDGEVPFMVSDLGSCNDISGTIGITGTPVIDPTSDTIYFWAKSYMSPTLTGYQNGAYYFHAIDAVTLKERPGFPTNIQGKTADNDATRYFTGGTVLQRASLNMVNGIIFAGFGGHCDQYNYTGWVVGMSTKGQYLTGYVTSGGPNAPAQDGTWNGGGGGCGVWMAGMPLVSDTSGRLFFSTGNAYKVRDNGALAASGRIQLDTLSEAIVNLAVNSTTGALTQGDYFESYQYAAMDAADRDLGSGGVILLDSSTFSGGGVERVAVACGKNGNCYITNADNLGGYKLGPGGGDNILQTLTPPSGGSFFGNPASYPLEGGYLYMTPINSPTSVFSLGFDSNGRPQFTFAASTGNDTVGAGVGAAAVTTLKGEAGTGILWILDPQAGIKAYNAVPSNGALTRIPLPPSPSVSKYQRVVFGNGRYYLTTTAGTINGYGSPVAQPLSCNSPLDFGSVAIGSNKTLSVVCTANIAIRSLNITAPVSTLYQVTNPAIPIQGLTAGASFSFNATFGTGSSTVPGIHTVSLIINTVNSVAGYSTQQPISLTGQTISANPYPSVTPLEVDFPPLVIGSAAAETGSASAFNVGNIGQSSLIILGYAFTNSSPTAAGTNVSMSNNGTYILDSQGVFTSPALPAIGTVIQGGSSITIDVVFNTTTIGSYFSILEIFTNGGMIYTTLVGTSDSAPIALLEVSTGEGGWTTIPDCVDTASGCPIQINMGSALGATQLTTTIKFTNMGGSDLIIDKSKPLEGSVLSAVNPTSDLVEGLTIPPGHSASAAISFSPGLSVLNSAPVIYSGIWTLNTNDLTFGTHALNFTASQIAAQVGPQINGQAQFEYMGCYQDSVNSRIQQQEYNNVNNTNGLCQTQALNYNAAFAGTEYNVECWVGNNIPSTSLKVSDSFCTTYLCPGDSSQVCGGVGGYMSLYYDTTKYFPQNGSLAASVQPASNQATVGAYSYLGCYPDSSGARSLTGKNPGAQSTMTLEACASLCAGYTYFGTEYADECYCGNLLNTIASPAVSTTCNMICAGNKHELCGGSSRLSVYILNGTIPVTSVSSATTTVSSTTKSTPSSIISSAAIHSAVGAYVYVGCQSDTVAVRTLTSKYTPSSSMTIELCAKTCSGYTYFGVEYADECYCGNSLGASTLTTDGRCSMNCAGNTAEICGGSSGLSLFQLASSINGTSSRVTPPMTTSSITNSALITTAPPTSTMTTSTAHPTPTAAINCPSSNATIYTATNGDTFYLECYIDRTNNDLSMVYTNTYALCAESCAYTSGCVGFSWLAPGPASPCYMKKGIGSGTAQNAVWGARRLTATLSTSSHSYTLSSSTSSSTVSTSPSSLLSVSTTHTSSSSLFSVLTASTSSSSLISLPTTSTSLSLSTSPSSSLSFSTTRTISSSSTTSSTASTSSSTTSTSSSFSSTSSSTTSTSSPFSSTSSYSSSKSSSSLITSSYSSSKSSSSSITSSSSSITSPGSSITHSSSSLSSSTTSSKLLSTPTATSASSSTTKFITSTTSGISSTSSTQGTTLPSSSSSPWNYLGCVADSTTSRTLSNATFTNSSMTIVACQNYCQAANYPLAGVEYATQCYCGISLDLSVNTTQSGCTKACGGASGQICGGSSRLSVYQNTAYVQPVIPSSVGAYNLQGCYSDSSGARALNAYTWTSSTSMTVEACVGVCSKYGFGFAGVEYGGECYCGKSIAKTSTSLSLVQCKQKFCNANVHEYCGGGGSIAIYSSQ